MSNKLIDLNALSAYKTSSDAKYQDKLTAGSSISLTNNVVSVAPTLVDVKLNSKTVGNNTVVEVGSVTLAPGNYVIVYSCEFSSNSSGYRQCGFSTNTTDITGFGRSWGDTRSPVTTSSVDTTTRVDGVFDVSATDYPNGRTFYFLAKQTSGSSLTAYPRYYYFKF